MPAPVTAGPVWETSSTTGTGTLDLEGAKSGEAVQSFVGAGLAGKKVFYRVVHTDGSLGEWEEGIGTVTDDNPDTLSRDTVIKSSNGGSLVNFSAGGLDVFISPIAGWTDGLVKLEETVVSSSVSAVDFTGLTGDYNAYRVLFTGIVPSDDAVDFIMRTSSDGGSTFDASSGDYEYQKEYIASSSASILGSAQPFYLVFKDARNNSSWPADKVDGWIDLLDPSASEYTVFRDRLTAIASDALYAQQGGGARKEEAAVDAVRFLMRSGDIEAGRFELYGVV